MRAKLPANLRFRASGYDSITFKILAALRFQLKLSPISTVTTILVLTGLVGQFGEEALAGYGIGSRIEFLMSSLIFGIGATMTSLVGMSIGAAMQIGLKKLAGLARVCLCSRGRHRHPARCLPSRLDTRLY